jgi:predicted Zn finger-like uncharacterized protein
MDVRCPRCQSEYELDDARVSDDGVTVKCSECQHVFRVKRKSLVMTLPVRDDAGAAALPPTSTPREWRVRQPNGNTYLCKELTTLQKWIIERKVGRDDEISLTGETWKRLGDIPELASFFQVVEDANKARAYELRASQVDLPAVSPPPPPAPSIPPGARIHETWKEPNFSLPEQPPPPPAPSVPPADPLRETMRAPSFSAPLPEPKSKPRPLPQPQPELLDDKELEKAVRGGGLKWGFLIIGGLLVGGGAGYYFGFYEPEQQAKAETQRLADQRLVEEQARIKAEQEAMTARVKAEAEAAAAKQRELEALADAGAADAGIDAGAPVDAGPPAIVASADAGAKVATPTGPPPGKSYDFYMERGDALRDAEKYGAALNYYGRAADLKPDRVEPIVGRGFAQFDLGQMQSAEASFEQALRTNARYGPAIMGMAEVMKAQGKKAKALEYYQRYLDEHPNGSEANVARNAIERLK